VGQLGNRGRTRIVGDCTFWSIKKTNSQVRILGPTHHGQQNRALVSSPDVCSAAAAPRENPPSQAPRTGRVWLRTGRAGPIAQFPQLIPSVSPANARKTQAEWRGSAGALLNNSPANARAQTTAM
jgi:hypothetical protein